MQRNSPMKSKWTSLETKLWSDAQENPNKWLMEMIRTAERWRTEFNQEIETPKRAQAEMKVELKNPGLQTENP